MDTNLIMRLIDEKQLEFTSIITKLPYIHSGYMTRITPISNDNKDK